MADTLYQVTDPKLIPSPQQTSVGLTGNTSGDYNYQNDLNNIFKDQSQLDSEAALAAQRAKEDYKSLYDQAAKAYKNNREKVKQGASSRGMLYSGAYVKDQGDVADQNVQAISGITKDSARYFEDLSRQTAQRKADAEKARLDAETRQAQIKQQEELQKALIEAQSKQYAAVQAAFSSGNVSNSNSNTSTEATPINVITPTSVNSSYVQNLTPMERYWWIYNNQSADAAAQYAKENGL